MGSGKTLVIISLMNMMIHYGTDFHVILLSKQSLRDNPWFQTAKKWLRNYEVNINNFTYISYDSQEIISEFMSVFYRMKEIKKIILVVEESHNITYNIL